MLATEIKKLTLAVAVPNRSDGTSFYRSLGPLSAMVREDPRLELRPPPQVPGGLDYCWDWLAPCDALFIQRPFLPVHVGLCKLAQSMELPIWIDWDDDVACVQPSNPQYPNYARHDEIAQTMAELARAAAVVSAPTQELLTRYVMPAKQRLIPNACHHKFHELPRERRVSWRGTASHMEDLEYVEANIKLLARMPQFGRWRWLFMGDPPWQVQRMVPAPRLEIDGGAPPTMFVPLLAVYAPYVHMVPLKPNRFNTAKSNVAWLEATCAGAVVVAPKSPEWSQPGVVTYSNPNSFQEALHQLMNSYDEGKMPPGLAASREHIREHLMLRTVNQKRWEVLEQLYEQRPR